MDQEALNSILFKVNMLVDKVFSLEYKFDILNAHLKHKRQQEAKQEDEGVVEAQKLPILSPSQMKLNVNNRMDNHYRTATAVYFQAQNQKPDFNWTLTPAHGPALDNVFKAMDVDTLKNVRLVCKAWNAKVVPELSSKTWIDFHKWENSHDSSGDPIPLDSVYQMMDLTVDGLVLIKGIAFTYACFDVRELESQVILREFGTNLNSISFDSPTISVIKQVLETWCRNLEELTIICTEDISLEGLAFSLGTTLKLKSLKILPTRSYIDASSYSAPLIEIAKSSPLLNSITMGEQTTCSEFFTGIAPCQEITKNFTELDICDGNEELNFEDLFLPKLAKLNIRNKCSWVTPLITKVAGTLQTLTLGFPTGSYFDDDDGSDDTDDTGDNNDNDHNIFNTSKYDYPDLSRVQVFKLKGFLQTDSSIRSLECKKMSNLQVFYINVNQGDLDTVLLKSDLYEPVLTLRKLTLIGSISCALSFQILVTLFPNIIRLKLGLARKFQSDYSMSDCLKDGIQKFAGLENLQAFSLFFDCSLCDNISDIIGTLKELTGLTEFELGNFDRGREVVNGLFCGIQQVPQISCITLINIVLILTEAQRLLDELKLRGTRLKVVEEVPFREKM